jgi:hypothetical protein
VRVVVVFCIPGSVLFAGNMPTGCLLAHSTKEMDLFPLAEEVLALTWLVFLKSGDMLYICFMSL